MNICNCKYCESDYRQLTEYEKKCLLDWWVNNYADQYSTEENKLYYDKWFKNLSWSEIDYIMQSYTNEDNE